MKDARPIPADVVALEDYARHAARLIAPEVGAYIDGAGADGLTHAANMASWRAIALQGRVLRDMSGASTAIRLFGQQLAHPILLAPCASHGLVHRDGENATALGAAAAEAVMVVSTQAGLRLEDIAARAQGVLWFQLYMQWRREDSLDLVRRAEDAGYRALVITVDAPVSGLRNIEQRAGFALPAHLRPPNLDGYGLPDPQPQPGRAATFLGLLDQAPRWEDIIWLRGQTRLPIIMKGITAPEDARLSIEAGIDGIIVSNHGGRVLDSLPATSQILPRICDAVAGRLPVLVDGGIRRGTDVLKAIALGADAVMIGRPQLHALAVGGAAGVAHMISILRAEFEVAMALTGCAKIADIDRKVLF